MIRAQGLTKQYGTVRAVDDVSFEIGSGEIVGFLGPNGAGKSTTMRMLTGVLHPDAGQIEIAGVKISEDPREARARTGYLPEHNPLYRELPVDVFLDFAARARGLGSAQRRRAVGDALERCDLDGMERRRIGQLSKGYRQRVGLAQALLGDPKVLILDEPTSGLDPAEIVRIRELIARLAGSRTVLLSTHVLSEVEELASRILILAGGRLVADGTPQALTGSESRELLVGLRVPAHDADEVLRAVTALMGAESAENEGSPEGERLRLRLQVTDPSTVAESVSALAAERGWPLAELRPVEPDLESIFLRRTARPRASEGGAR